MKTTSAPPATSGCSPSSARRAMPRAFSICPVDRAVRPQQPTSVAARRTPAAASSRASASPTPGSWYWMKQSTKRTA